MASKSQIEANRRNSRKSTGPRTESGKSKSSKNHLTYGLYTHQARVQPGEEEIYAEFCQTLYDQLTPGNLLEETFVFEITGASWRLRCCAAAEGDLDLDFDESTDKRLRSIERARAAAHCVINRSMKQLRTIQTERIIRQQLNLGSTDDSLAADSRQIGEAHKRFGKMLEQNAKDQINQAIAEAMTIPPDLKRMLEEDDLDTRISGASDLELASNCEPARDALSRCESGPEDGRVRPYPHQNGPETDGGGQCCGKNDPWPIEEAA